MLAVVKQHLRYVGQFEFPGGPHVKFIIAADFKIRILPDVIFDEIAAAQDDGRVEDGVARPKPACHLFGFGGVGSEAAADNFPVRIYFSRKRPAQADAGMAVHEPHLHFQPVRRAKVVTVKVANVFAACFLCGSVPATRNAHIGLVAQQADARVVKFPDRFQSAVGGGIVNEQEFKITESLYQYAGNCFGKVFLAVVHRYGYGYAGRMHAIGIYQVKQTPRETNSKTVSSKNREPAGQCIRSARISSEPMMSASASKSSSQRWRTVSAGIYSWANSRNVR